MSRVVYVLIHSPLVGALTWNLVAGELRKRDVDVLVPALNDAPDSEKPFWKQHADSVSESLVGIPNEQSLTLVAHSGAGPLLPAIRKAIPNPVAAYVFVDAGIPREGATRLDLMKSEDPAWAAQFQAELEGGSRFPNWSMDDLQEIIPDALLRRQMVAEIRPRGLDFFSEPIPVFEGWPDAPCAFIQFSPPYDKPAGVARQAGWIVEVLKAGHFHMLVDPQAVADSIVRSVHKTLNA